MINRLLLAMFLESQHAGEVKLKRVNVRSGDL
jgi:hypothetical protein